MSTLALIPLLLAPAGSDGAPAEPAPAIEAWSPEAAEPAPEPGAPEPAPAASAPAPQPMPVPIPPPNPAPGAPAYGAAPPPADAPPLPRRAPKHWPDRPIRWRVDVAGHLGTHTLFDPAWRAFDEDRRAFHLGLTLRGDFRLGDGRVFLGGGLSFQRFASHRTHPAFGAAITVREPLAFLRLSIVAVEGVDVFVQAGGGPSITWLYLDATKSAEQRNIGALVGGLAGLALYLPKKWLPRRGSSRVTGGLELGLGYDWRSKIPVRPAVLTDDEPIDTTTSPLGGLIPHGLTWRFGLFVRFQ